MTHMLVPALLLVPSMLLLVTLRNLILSPEQPARYQSHAASPYPVDGRLPITVEGQPSSKSHLR